MVSCLLLDQKKPESGEDKASKLEQRLKMPALLLFGGRRRGQDRARGGLRYPLISKSWPAAAFYS